MPPGTDVSKITLADAVKYLSLPRELGEDAEGQRIIASIGRFGPYIGRLPKESKGHSEFRSLKKGDDPYTVTLDRALAVLAEPKKPPKGVEIVREIGAHPKTGKLLVLYKSKQGFFLKKGLRRIYLPESVDAAALTPLEAAEFVK